MITFEQFDYCADGLDILRCLDPFSEIQLVAGTVIVIGELTPNKFEPEDWVLMERFGWSYEKEGRWVWSSSKLESATSTTSSGR